METKDWDQDNTEDKTKHKSSSSILWITSNYQKSVVIDFNLKFVKMLWCYYWAKFYTYCWHLAFDDKVAKLGRALLPKHCLCYKQFVRFANIEEDTPSYHRRYDFFVSKFSAMCHSNHSDKDTREKIRLAGIQGLQVRFGHLDIALVWT